MYEFTNRLTPELNKAINIVCGACPYIESYKYEAGEKYCGHCMVWCMYNLFRAENDNQDWLPEIAPEWQAIINY